MDATPGWSAIPATIARRVMDARARRSTFPSLWARAIQATGDQGGVPRQVIAVDNSQPSSSTPPDNDAGVRAPLISSPQLLSTRHHPVAVVVMFVDNRVATPTSMNQELCLHWNHQPWDVLSVDSEVAIPPAMRRMLSHRLTMLQASR